MTKFSGFLISWAMPAVSWPSEAIFSAWIRLAWAAFSRSSESRSSVNSRTFSMAITAWAAKVSSSSTCCGVKAPGLALAQADGTDGGALAHQGCGEDGAEAKLGAERCGVAANFTAIERRDVGNVDGAAVEDGGALKAFADRAERRARARARGASWAA